MNSIVALIWSDFIFIKRWFLKETIGKLLVFSAFILLFLSLSFFINLIANKFFQNLFTFERFGLLTADYIIHAVIILILWLSIASSVASTLTFLVIPNSSRDYLSILPVSSFSISFWLFLKSIIINCFFLFIVLFPLTLSFEFVFAENVTLLYILKLIFLIVSLVTLSASIGSLIAYQLAVFIHDKFYYAAVAGIGLFFFGAYAILKIIFPTSLTALYSASPEYFEQIYYQLPLVNSLIPTNLLVNTYLNGFTIESLLLVSVIIFIAFLSISDQTNNIRTILQELRVQISKKIDKQKSVFKKSFDIRSTLILKDWYSCIRTPSEAGYGIFLLTLVIFFFVFLSKATQTGEIERKHINDLIVFSFDWFVFFSTAFLLRLIFPLMAKEGPSFWYLFSLPIDKKEILDAKLILGLLLTIPICSFSIILWIFFPYAAEMKVLLILISIISILFLSGINSILGAIYPNFGLGYDPEKVSTGSMGIITLLLSFLATVGLSFLLYKVISGQLSGINALLSVIFSGIFVSSFFYVIATNQLRRYHV